MKWWKQLTEAAPIIWRLLISGDVDRFELESRAYRARHGIQDRS